jgi:integrase/recombinase XerD
MAQMSPLRQRMIEDLTIRNLSPATQQSYLHAVSKFSQFFRRSPDHLGCEEVRAYQVHLVGWRVSWGALNQTVCALRFFYGVTMGRTDLPEQIPYARTPRKLPVVSSADEVVGFLEAVRGLRNRVALATTYATGLRALEATRLKVADIDSGRMVSARLDLASAKPLADPTSDHLSSSRDATRCRRPRLRELHAHPQK